VPGSIRVGLHPDFLALIGCFAKARCRYIVVRLDQLRVPFLGPRELLLNKVASGRDKDLIDAANLRELISARKKRRKG
jgi:hypothetical protein